MQLASGSAGLRLAPSSRGGGGVGWGASPFSGHCEGLRSHAAPVAAPASDVGLVVKCATKVQEKRRSTTNRTTGTESSRGGTLRFFGASSKEDEEDSPSKQQERYYFNFTGFPFPLAPFLERKTIRNEVERGSIWTFEQEQGLGLSSVTTNIRMTVIKLKSGGLWVHSPIAPTKECLALLKGLGAPVEHIVLPTFAYEHKVFVGPFARRFPKAKVWTAPLQWSWPVNLPLPLLGIFGANALTDSGSGAAPSWADEIEYKVLSTPEVGIGPYVEVAFFHRASRTLLLTDAVILVPPTAPAVVSPASLLAAAENGLAVQVLAGGQEVPKVDVQDTPEFRRLGWQRMVLQILYFGPANLLDPADSFSRIAGRLTVSPVVKTLVFDKVPQQVKTWIDRICSDWNFVRIIPCHFSAPIRASPNDLRSLFDRVLAEALGDAPPAQDPPAKGSFFDALKGAFAPLGGVKGTAFPEEDLRTLRSLDSTLVTLGAVKKTGT